MTLRIIDQLFSDLILEQSKKNISLNLTYENSPLEFLHPKMAKAILEFMNDPEKSPEKINLTDYYFLCFSKINEAQEKFPELIPIKCSPYHFSKFLNKKTKICLFDLGNLGCFILSDSKLPITNYTDIHDHLLPPFIRYALSSDLWGPKGKWPRFHERLHKLFENYNLLNAPDSPGFYPLRPVASKLQQSGVSGSLINESFTLILPWTFSLSALEKLERIISQEF